MVFFLLFLLVSCCNLCQSCYYGFALRYKDSDGYKILLVLYMLRGVLLFSDLPNRSNLTNLTNTTIEQNYSKANMTNLTNIMIRQNYFKTNMEMIEQLLRGMVFFLLFLLVS